jgi:HEAT repeat protein
MHQSSDAVLEQMRCGMFWLRMLFVLALLSPSVGWCLEPEEDGIKELIRDLKDPDPAVRGTAVIELEKVGPEARAAIPALIAILKDAEFFHYVREHSSGTCDVGHAAYKALHAIGLEAVPALTRVVANQTGDAQRYAICALSDYGPRARTALEQIAKIASVPDANSNFAMLIALNELDVEGSTAIPILERYLTGEGLDKKSRLSGQAIDMFDKYLHHPRTLPVLLSALKNSNPEVRGGALQVLAKLPVLPEPVVESVVSLLHDNQLTTAWMISANCAYEGTRSIKFFAMNTLAVHGAAGEVVVPELLKELDIPVVKDDDSNVRMVLQSIPRFRKLPPGTVARIFKYYQRIGLKRRSAGDEERIGLLYDELFTISCLAKLPAQTAELSAKWKVLIESPDEFQRFEAAIILATLDAANNPIAVALVEEVIDLQTRGKEMQAKEVDEANEENPEEDAQGKLEARRAKLFPGVWLDLLPTMAIKALMSNPKLSDRCLPKLFTLLQNDKFAWRDSELMEFVKQAGPKAKELGPAFIENRSAKYHTAAFVALGPEMVPLLIANAQRQLHQYEAEPAKYWFPTTSMELFPEFGSAAEIAWPVIQDYLKSSNSQFRILAFYTVEKMSGLHEKSLPELIQGLKDSRCIVRVAAASSLGAFHSQREVVVPALIEALRDDYADMRAAALESLAKLGIDQPGVREVFQNAQLDSHPYIKLLATETLEKK